MQDKIVLGFLMSGNKTGYKIKKMMEVSTSYFFNTSLGSIYPALKKLEKNQMVNMKELVKKGRLQKVYTITPKGKEHFHEWLQSEPTVFKIRTDALLKIFFFGFLSSELREKQLASTLSQLDLQIEDLKEIQTMAETLEDVDYFQMLSLKYGIDILINVHEMLQDFKAKLEKEGDGGDQ